MLLSIILARYSGIRTSSPNRDAILSALNGILGDHLFARNKSVSHSYAVSPKWKNHWMIRRFPN